MDIEHQRGGDMIIGLSRRDVGDLQDRQYCMDRGGLEGSESKVWVRHDPLTHPDKPTAQIDGGSDVYVLLPHGAEDLPARIDQADIDPYMDPDRGRVEFHFGELGGIVVKAQ